jgi:hypothetical protein
MTEYYYPIKYAKSMGFAIEDMREKGDKGPASLRGHIVNDHFSPAVLPYFGVARFDTVLAAKLDIDLTWAVKEGMLKLEGLWPNGIAEDFQNPPASRHDRIFKRLGLPWGEDWCKMMIVKNFLYFERLRRAAIDWDRVVAAVPDARSITLDIERDSFDPLEDYI